MSFVLKTLFSSAAKELIGTVGNIIDNTTTSKEEKGNLKRVLFSAISAKLIGLAKMGRDVIMTEMSGNWLQKSWRPITMLCFTWIVMYKYFVSPVFGLPDIDLDPRFWELLKLGLGGYVVGRSVEKVAQQFANNPDMLKRKK